MEEKGGEKMIKVFGGKIKKLREMEERGVNRIKKILKKMGGEWKKEEKMKGGEIENEDYEKLENKLREKYKWMKRKIVNNYGRIYGERKKDVVDGEKKIEGIGSKLGGDLNEEEVRYMVEREWEKKEEEIIYRRKKN